LGQSRQDKAIAIALHARRNKFQNKNVTLASNALFDKFADPKGKLDYDKVKINESVRVVDEKKHFNFPESKFVVEGVSRPTRSEIMSRTGTGSQHRQFGIFKNKSDADKFAKF